MDDLSVDFWNTLPVPVAVRDETTACHDAKGSFPECPVCRGTGAER